ncbi:DsbA family protein [Salinisphaera sp.]|uniref:DsbA family protein n=1 Tax=Salinisphaera sp. TaxID=1914330 RepID=UPI002D7717D1|nr:DsbA family protein [Salinisphaera sp.]HET7313430.1 DsbA family protein [Salinisphaera sp.]
MSPQNNKSQSSLFGALFFPVLVIGALIVIAILVMSFTGNKRTAPSPGDNIRQLSADTMATLRNQYDQLGEAIGDPDAPVTVREFGDYQCPACGNFEPTAERIRNEYVDSGKVRFIFFDFPLSMHPNAQTAAIAARCAGRQDKFWPYHSRLYQTQSKWAEKSDPSSAFLDLGLEAGLNTGKLKACMKNKTPLATINKERGAGEAIRLRATPTVLVGNTEFVGGPSYAKLKKAIDDALSAAGAGGQSSGGDGG